MGEKSAAIRLKALQLGFEAVTIAQAGTIARQAEFQHWLERGYQGEMQWMERPYRQDPRLLDVPVESLIVVALNYWDPAELTCNPLEGRISRYARGDDYHAVLQERLKPLVAYVQELGGQAKSWVDASPISEKPWASFGWQGKNANVIRQHAGSWFFLGTVATDLVLDPDTEQTKDRCGLCTRCLTACPTGAIVAPYVVDARRCISYLTIELKGPIPRDLRPLIGNRIFGCDDCQEVCPWNRFARPGLIPARAENTHVLLTDLLMLDDEGFRRRFPRSAVRRAKRRGLLRNVCVALGNSMDPAAIPALALALNDGEPLVRGHAAWALGRIGGAHDEIRRRQEIETDLWVREELALASATLNPGG